MLRGVNEALRSRSPGALRALDSAIACFAIWTLGANTAALCGFGLDTAALVAGLVVIGALGVRSRRSSWFVEPASALTPPLHPRDRGTPLPGAWRVGGVLAAGLAVAALAQTGDPRWLWAPAVAGLAFVALRERDATPPGPTPRDAPWLLWATAALGAVIASTAHRPDADDAFYIQAALAAAAAPNAPLLAEDTLHGIPGLPLILPVYRLHSLEMLWAAVSRWTGAPVLDLAHIVTPALAGALVPLAQARLLRLLLPGRWPWGLAVVLGFLLLAGGAIHSFGQFGFVRLHQGKGLLVAVLLPAIAAYAIEFARRPTLTRGLRLAAAQVAALGCSASAAWLGPAVAGLALLAALPPMPGAARTLGLGALTAVYPLALGASAVGATRQQFTAAAERGELLTLSDPELAASVLSPVLGTGPLAVGLLIALLAGAALACQPTTRRFLAVFTLGFLLVFWNPFDANWIAHWLTGPGTYWRVFWVMPLPALVAVVATSTVAPSRPWGAAAGTSAALLLMLGLASDPVITPGRGSGWRAPGWRVPDRVQPLLGRLIADVGEEGTVLLPLDVAPWSVLFERAPTPLVVRPEYLGVLRARYDEREIDRRKRLAHTVSASPSHPRAAYSLGRAVQDYDLRAVVLSGAARSDPAIATRLRQLGFDGTFEDDHYALWVRPQGALTTRNNRGL